MEVAFDGLDFRVSAAGLLLPRARNYFLARAGLLRLALLRRPVFSCIPTSTESVFANSMSAALTVRICYHPERRLSWNYIGSCSSSRNASLYSTHVMYTLYKHVISRDAYEYFCRSTGVIASFICLFLNVSPLKEPMYSTDIYCVPVQSFLTLWHMCSRAVLLSAVISTILVLMSLLLF